jgi:hypothetical protein
MLAKTEYLLPSGVWVFWILLVWFLWGMGRAVYHAIRRDRFSRESDRWGEN